MRQHGTVKFFDPRKGWGIINAADGAQLFVHYTGIQGAGRRRVNLQDGEAVEFDVQLDARGPKAVGVTRGAA